MATRSLGLWKRLVRAGVILLFAGGAGCTRSEPTRASSSAPQRIDTSRVYDTYRFDRSPNVLSFGVQPLWIPTCIVWEVMARDARLREDLTRAGFRLDAFPFFKGADVNRYLLSGKLQGCIGGDLSALKAAAASDVRIVSLIQQGPNSIVAREALPLKQLRRRRIGYARDSNAHYTLLLTLREHQNLPEEVQLVNLDVTHMAGALASGRIDTFSAWEPTPTLTLLEYPSFEVLDRRDVRGFVYFARPFFDAHPEVVRAIVAAEARALQWLRSSDKNVFIASRWARDRAVQFRGGEMPLTVYHFPRLARRDILRLPDAPRLLPELLDPGGDLHRQFLLAREFKLIEAGADWDRVRRSFAVNLVPQILAAPRRYRLDEMRFAEGMTSNMKR